MIFVNYFHLILPCCFIGKDLYECFKVFCVVIACMVNLTRFLYDMFLIYFVTVKWDVCLDVNDKGFFNVQDFFLNSYDTYFFVCLN